MRLRLALCTRTRFRCTRRILTIRSGRTLIDVPEVIEAADEVAAKIGKPGPHEKHSDWDSIKHRMDDVMRNKIRDLYGVI